MKSYNEFYEYYKAKIQSVLSKRREVRFASELTVIAMILFVLLFFVDDKLGAQAEIGIIIAVFVLFIAEARRIHYNMPAIKKMLAVNETLDVDAMKMTAEFLGLKYDRVSAVSFEEIKASHLLSMSNKKWPCYLDHVFYGPLRGRMVEILQIHFAKIVPGDNTESYFITRNTICSYNFDIAFKGTVVVFKNSVSKSLYYSKLAGLKKVLLEWGAFEDMFDLYATDPVQARLVMTPDVMSATYDFYSSHPDNDLTLTFHEGKIMLIFEDAPVQIKHKVEFDYCPANKTWSYFGKLYERIAFLRALPEKMAFKGFQKEYEYDDDERKRRLIAAQNTPAGFKARRQIVPAHNMDQDGIPPLIKSIIDGDPSATRALLAIEDIEVNAPLSLNGNTALHIAVWNDNSAAVRLLLAHARVDRHIKNHTGKTPLDLAKEKDNCEIIILLEK